MPSRVHDSAPGRGWMHDATVGLWTTVWWAGTGARTLHSDHPLSPRARSHRLNRQTGEPANRKGIALHADPPPPVHRRHVTAVQPTAGVFV